MGASVISALTSLDGAPVVGWTLLAVVVLTAVWAAWMDGRRPSEGSDYQQGERR